jgi:hypothetical protein
MRTLAILTALCFVLAGVSFAGTVVITEVVTGGNLTLTMPSNFSLAGITIGGASSQDATGNATYTMEDARGSGAGWNVGFQIGQFVTSGTPQRSIATTKTKMSIQDANITCTWGQAVEATTAHGPASPITTATAVAGTEVKGVTAAADHGMGKYAAIAAHTLVVDADRYAGTYTATLTATLNNAP